MASASQKSKKSGGKPSRDRPTATGAIAQPVLVGTSTLNALSAYSPKGELFALVSLSVDKHRLRIFNTSTGNVASEHIVETARVTALKWTLYDSSDPASDAPAKKRKKRGSNANALSSNFSQGVQVLALGLSDGSIVIFSPSHGKIIRTLSHASSTSPILSLSYDFSAVQAPLWSSSEDGTIRAWHPLKNEILTSWKNDDRIGYSSLALRPGAERAGGRVQILAARHNIRLFAAPNTSPAASESQKPNEVTSVTGHSSPIFALEWDITVPPRESSSSAPPTRFVSAAENDRVINVWEVPSAPGAGEGKLVASVPLESDARQLGLAVSASGVSSSEQQALLAVSASGAVSVFTLPPSAESSSTPSKKDKKGVPTLKPQCTVSVAPPEKGDSADSGIVAATFLPNETGRIGVVRLVGGLKPVFDTVQYLDDNSNFVPAISLTAESTAKLAKSGRDTNDANNQRYVESSTLAIRSGLELGEDPASADIPVPIEGDLDVEVAELTLGERLKALTGAGESSGGAADPTGKESAEKDDRIMPVPANSLSRTLTQALHSSDSRLLETCIAHSDPVLIRNTVQRLPPQLAVPLLNACVERLGRGHRGSNQKGGGGGASAQRGSALIKWVKAVLVVHTAHLMNIPDLVSRLSALHATLTSRLLLQDRLLTLNGRLDLVLSQIDLRTASSESVISGSRKKGKKRKANIVTKYVEGESSDEDEGMDVDEDEDEDEVEVESGDEEGSVEDIELGGEGDEDDSEEDDEDEEDEDEDEDEDSEDEGGNMNGFIDDEAEESYGEDESEEDDDED